MYPVHTTPDPPIGRPASRTHLFFIKKPEVRRWNLRAGPGGNPASYAAGAYIPTLKGDKARNSGQFGASFRRYFESIDSEIGLYAMKIHSRTPVVSVVYDKAGTNGTLSPISAKWEYPEDVKVYGASISSSLAGWRSRRSR